MKNNSQSFASEDQHNGAEKYFHGSHPILTRNRHWQNKKKLNRLSLEQSNLKGKFMLTG